SHRRTSRDWLPESCPPACVTRTGDTSAQRMESPPTLVLLWWENHRPPTAASGGVDDLWSAGATRPATRDPLGRDVARPRGGSLRHPGVARRAGQLRERGPSGQRVVVLRGRPGPRRHLPRTAEAPQALAVAGHRSAGAHL